MVLFQPGAAEVHAQAGKWFDDREIYEWFAANLHQVREPSMRHYVRAKALKAAGMDWTDVLAAEDENRRARLAVELLASAADGSTGERVKAFVEHGGGCRATFFNYYPGSKEGHIPTRSASEGSGAFPSLARRVNMQQHAELPCRGNTNANWVAATEQVTNPSNARSIRGDRLL